VQTFNRGSHLEGGGSRKRAPDLMKLRSLLVGGRCVSAGEEKSRFSTGERADLVGGKIKNGKKMRPTEKTKRGGPGERRPQLRSLQMTTRETV